MLKNKMANVQEGVNWTI